MEQLVAFLKSVRFMDTDIYVILSEHIVLNTDIS